eukprot:g9052.t1
MCDLFRGSVFERPAERYDVYQGGRALYILFGYPSCCREWPGVTKNVGLGDYCWECNCCSSRWCWIPPPSSSGGTNATAPNLVPNLQRKREAFFRNVKDLLSSALEQIGGSLHAADAAAAEDPLAPRTIVKNAVGLLGFVRFLRGYYLVLVTKKKTVGVLGNHKIFEVEKVELLPLFAAESDDTEEQRWAERWLLVLRNGNFYFAHSYELSRTVQQNMADKALALVPRRREDSSDVVAAADDVVRAAAAAAAARDPFYSDPEFFRFVWNEHLLRAPMLEMTVVQRGGGRPASTSSTTRVASLASNPLWRPFCLTIIHGVFARTTVSSYSQQLEVALLSRRSARFAGTRFRKRGLNARGHCGNDVETEQIVYRERPNSVLAFGMVSFKPPIAYPREDSDHVATKRHLRDLLRRYGSPLVFLNLMRGSPGTDEQALSARMEAALQALAAEVRAGDRSGLVEVLYHHLDLKAAAKLPQFSRIVAETAEALVDKVGYFHADDHGTNDAIHADDAGLHYSIRRVQAGVIRVNCVDCLDRTNVLMFFLGREHLRSGHAAGPMAASSSTTTAKRRGASGAYNHVGSPPEGGGGTTSIPRGRAAGGGPPGTGRSLFTIVDDVEVEVEQQEMSAENLVARGVEENENLSALLNELYDASGDYLSMQYAGSVAHKKYQPVRKSKELLTSIQRQYQTSFQDAEKQMGINLFLGELEKITAGSLGLMSLNAAENLFLAEVDAFVHQAPLHVGKHGATARARNFVRKRGSWFVAPLLSFGHRLLALKYLVGGGGEETPAVEGCAIPPWVVAYCVPEFSKAMRFSPEGRILGLSPRASGDWVAARIPQEQEPTSETKCRTRKSPDSSTSFTRVHRTWKLSNFEKVPRLENTALNVSIGASPQPSLSPVPGGGMADKDMTTVQDSRAQNSLLPKWALRYEAPKKKFRSMFSQSFLDRGTPDVAGSRNHADGRDGELKLVDEDFLFGSLARSRGFLKRLARQNSEGCMTGGGGPLHFLKADAFSAAATASEPALSATTGGDVEDEDEAILVSDDPNENYGYNRKRSKGT